MKDTTKFLELVTKQEELQEQLDKVREELNTEMAELGVGTFTQDPVTSLVYKIVKPRGTFTYYRDIDYVRTAKVGERAGTLSKKEAEGAGFTLDK